MGIGAGGESECQPAPELCEPEQEVYLQPQGGKICAPTNTDSGKERA